jgi:hypothetical protein
MSQRTSVFADPGGEKKLDTSDFAPVDRSRERPRAEDIDAATKGSRFKSREPIEAPKADGPSTKRQPMVYRTGRNVTFSAKTTRETVDRFYALAEQNGWKAGETFEKAVDALQRQSRSSG